MNVFNKITAFKQGLALAAVMSMAGTAMAKNNGGVPADLSSDRKEVTGITLNLPACPLAAPTTPPAPPATPTTGQLSVYIFQSVGRLINIGTYSGTVPCDGNATENYEIPDPGVVAIEGFTFQPGPATLLVIYNYVDSLSAPQSKSFGARLNLHP